MKSYVPITFVFLGVAFYQLSGGADYAPRDGSLQAEAAKARAAPPVVVADAARTMARKPPVMSARSETPAVVTRAVMAVDLSAPVVAASTSPATQIRRPEPAAAATVETAARLESYSLARLSPAPLTSAAIAPDVSAEPTPDIRNVLKSRVNVRMGPGTQFSVVTKLDAGTPVEILQSPGEGWVKLRVIETGRVGWMSEALVSAAN